MDNKNRELKRTIGFFPALATVMGTVIGAGVFFKAASVAAVTGTFSLHMLAWFLGGVISLCAGLTGAELAAAIPETGGMLKHIEHTYGNTAAFLLGWAQSLIYFPATVAALSIIFATQVANLLGLSDKIIIPVAILAVTSILLVNLLGSKAGGIFQSVTLICKLIPLFLIVVFGLLNKGDVAVRLIPISDPVKGGFLTALAAGLLATLFAYDGWVVVGNIAGEMKKPSKDLPKAISFGLFGIMIVYLFINFVYLKTLPMSEIAGNSNASMDVAVKIFGGMGGKLVTIGILLSVYGGINGYFMTGMRTPYAMALENRLPFSKHLRKLSKTAVPYVSGIVELVIAVIMMTLGGFDTLTDMVMFVIWIFYTLLFVAVIILRKREPELHRPYKVPLYPVVPIIAILGGTFIVVMTIFTQTKLAMTGIILTVIGLPFYFYLKKKYKF
ncbi:MAG: amino acid permease [Lachnospiraceae bacterium]|jgi:APA family basic amino acid/polyamine antiporter|nr:amino acid permease [Lachnospiraceae bacterium]